MHVKTALPAYAVLAASLAGVWACMPGRSYDGAAPPLTAAQQAVRDRLRAHVYALAEEIGERNVRRRAGLEQARDYIEAALRQAGYEPARLSFVYEDEPFDNVEAVLSGTAPSARAIVIGAHYDSAAGSPGANDNASGVAVLLEVARALRDQALPAPLRFVAFTNEEPPYFAGPGMGSAQYVHDFAEPQRRIRAMLSLETVGLYRDEPGSQQYPPLVGLLYPDRGDFIGFVGNRASRTLVRRCIGLFRAVATLPSEAAALPELVQGVDWSDQRAFWQVGIPALMVTDTAPFRDPHYHRATDTADRLDYTRMARLVSGLEHVVASLARDGTDA